MVNFTLKNAENLLAAQASTQPLNDFPVDQHRPINGLC